MIDISSKPIEKRRAVVEGKLAITHESAELIMQDVVKKGNIYEVAKMAAMQAVKNAPQSIFYCHPVNITNIEYDFKLTGKIFYAKIAVECMDRTGPEMDALNGLMAALINVWDMVKYSEKDAKALYPHTKIFDVKIIEKSKNYK